MRRLAGPVAIALVACGDPPGLTLEVHVDSNISSVELFVGAHCHEGQCPSGVSPPGLTAKAVDDVILVDDPMPWPRPVAAGIAGFRIATDSDTTVGIIVVVGYDGQGVIRATRAFYDVAISASDAEVWRVEDLEDSPPISDNLADRPPDWSERIYAWKKPGLTTPACLLLEHWSTAIEPDRDLVVPATDTDCDGTHANECAPWIYDAPLAPPTLDTANCLLPVSDASGVTPICMIAGPECSERSMVTEACVKLPDDYCTPLDLCTACATSSTPYECLQAKIKTDTDNQTSVLPHLRCHIALDLDGDPCSSAPAVADGSVYLGSGGTKCTSIAINDLKPPLGPFVTAFEIDNGKLELDNFQQPCKVEVEFFGNATTHVDIGIAELALDNGRHLVVPARVDFVRGDCVVPSSCAFTRVTNTSESMLRCVTTAAALSCAPTGTCSGGECDGVCCGPGESCSNGTCSCGGGAPCADGQFCAQGVFSEDQCGSVCCGGGIPCPL